MSAAGLQLEPASREENARAREFMERREASMARKVTIEEMIAWVERKDAYQTASIASAHEIHGFLTEDETRASAVSLRLIEFLERCARHKEDIATLFRAKEHQRRGRR
jgi:hypothetical protein